MMQEAIVLGIIQGVTEWLPVSSEGVLVLVQTNVFGGEFGHAIRLSLFLHIGTFFAALVYLRKDIMRLPKERSVLWFLGIATVISGGLGFVLLEAAENIDARYANALIGGLLFVTGFLQLRKRGGFRKRKEVTKIEGVLLGAAQGLSAVPGLSRSGLTVAALLMRKFEEGEALRLSFLMSLPVVLGGNIVLQAQEFDVGADMILGAAVAFLFGLATIHGLLQFARRINFSYFVFVFALLTIASAFI